MAMLVMTFASCATKDKIPSEPPPPEPTTTTTVPAPVSEPVAPSGAETGEKPVVVQQPSVSEIELRNLFGQANALRNEALAYGVDKVLPEDYAKVNSDFAAVKAEYDGIMDQVGYDGVKAFPLKGKLENSVASWEELLAQGLPMRADEESEKAAGLKLAAVSAGARELAADRYEGAESLLADADALYEKGSYTMAIPAYQQAAAAFDVAAEKATANDLRSKISDKDYAAYAENFFVAGEQKYYAEEELWAAGSLADLKAGANSLRDANAYYGYVVSAGAEGKALEAKDAALSAQENALALGADRNVPDQYASATDIMNEALANHEAGNFESASLWFADAEAAYNDAAEASAGMKAENEAALASAREAIAAAENKQAVAGVEDTVYLPEAQYYLARAEIQSGNALFVDSTFNANEAKNYAGMSERFLDGVIAEQEAAAKALAEAKALADPAMDDARTRMAWAENNEIGKDYPAQYNEASAAMEGAELAYANERYAPAAELAAEVTSVLSDDFQVHVLAEREAAALLAQEKAEAEAAMGDAMTRMAWAENNNIAEDYPAEYKEASAAMEGAELAYANERYLPASELANEVSTVLSDEFMQKVLAEREAEEKLAADKAAAEAAMADAQDRMAWANENGIKEEYPEEFGAASTAMIASFNAYGNAQYPEATAKAEEVSSIFSDDFKAQVAMDREAAAAAEADKAEAEAAIGDATTRMAWAENNNIAEDYPVEYKEASAAMEGAELAYANERYLPATTLAEEVSSILSDEFMADVLADREAEVAKAEADVAIGEAMTRMAWAENNEIDKDYPAEYKEASAAMEGAELAYANERYAPATTLAEEVSSILSDEFMEKVLESRTPEAIQAAQDEAKKTEETQKAADANAAAKDSAYLEIDNAQARYDWAKDNNAENNYPDLFAKGGADLAKAKQAYGDGKFLDASALAKEAMKSLSSIKAFADLPAVYIVRLIPERRDCLWRIAEYPFIYNNPLKWPVLYEANKKTFKDPSNPDLIFPDQVLNIPAIKGETRSGTWDPKKTYNPLPKK
jgi:nucleoid-associated protein YgaU